MFLGVENISSAESETDTGTDTGGCGVINVPMEVPIKRRHNRNSCLLCSGGNRNNQRVSRWRKVSASSSHRTRTGKILLNFSTFIQFFPILLLPALSISSSAFSL